MFAMKSKTTLWMSVLIAFMAALASSGGLFFDGLYRDNALVGSAWRGNDIVTLFIAVPLLMISALFTLRASNRGRLFWMGSLWYMIYNYMFYLFGAAFNSFFLLYAALFVISVRRCENVRSSAKIDEKRNGYTERSNGSYCFE